MNVSNMLELVARMRREAFSRNRNFDAFAAADADGARARRVWRYLRSLEKDLSSASLGGETGVHLQIESHGDGGRRITIEVPSLHIRRVAIVNAEEYALLREHPDTRAVLDVAEGRRL